MRILAPAKINLHLRVGAVRDDGFHPLMTWMTTVRLFDILTTDLMPDPSGSGAGKVLDLSCNDPQLACDESNLIIKAANALRDHAQSSQDALRDIGPIRIRLEKNIPVGGGLGGGSSDAARMLLALNRLWRLDWPADKLSAIAQRLGSDMPFFLHGPSSICQGQGEIVQPVAPPRPGWALLILPRIAISTALVYQYFDALGLGKAQAPLDPPWSANGGPRGQEWPALSNVEETLLTSDALLPRLVNDLEQPAFAIAPELGRLRTELEQKLGRIVRMSGSGSTLFTLYDEERDAQDASQIVTNQDARAIAVKIAPVIRDDLQNL